MARPTRFGKYLRAQRVAAGLSLREVADHIGVSHVYLGEVERGVRGPLRQEHWPKLKELLPHLDEHLLEREAALSRPVQLRLEDAPPRFQDLGLALARRIENRDLKEDEMRKLLEILSGGRR